MTNIHKKIDKNEEEGMNMYKRMDNRLNKLEEKISLSLKLRENRNSLRNTVKNPDIQPNGYKETDNRHAPSQYKPDQRGLPQGFMYQRAPPQDNLPQRDLPHNLPDQRNLLQEKQRQKISDIIQPTGRNQSEDQPTRCTATETDQNMSFRQTPTINPTGQLRCRDILKMQLLCKKRTSLLTGWKIKSNMKGLRTNMYQTAGKKYWNNLKILKRSDNP